MINDVNSQGEGRGCAHAQLINDCMTLTYLSCLMSVINGNRDGRVTGPGHS